MVQIWDFPVGPKYCELLNPGELVNDIRHPINLQLFNMGVPSIVETC